MADDPAIEVSDLQHAYEAQKLVLTGLSLTVPQGRVIGLLGPNGSGKSTLFRILSTLLPIQQGKVLMMGSDVATSPETARRQIGVCFQSPSLDGRLTANENLNCHARIFGISHAVFTTRKQALLRELDLQEREHALVASLSGGLKRRVELAKTLLHQPPVLLLDEPTAGLDPAARRDFWDLLRRYRDEHGTTIVVATHLMDEAEYCDTLALICEGTVAATGSPAALRSELGESQFRIRVGNAERYAEQVAQSLAVETKRNGDVVTLSAGDPGAQTPILLELAGADLVSLEIARPTLEDVFLQHTGYHLTSAESVS